MMTHIKEEAAKWGCTKIMLGCDNDRVHFYEEAGFRKYENQMRLNMVENEIPVDEETTIRELADDDLDNEFLEILAGPKPAPYPLEKIKEIFNERAFKGIQTYVEVEEGRILATASLIVEPKYYGNVAFLEDVAVRNECRGRGLEERMITHIKGQAAKRQCYKIMHGCNDNKVDFYEKMGFIKHENLMRFDLPSRALG